MAELALAKRTRACLQGHLTRHVNRFNANKDNMNVVALETMIFNIEETEKKFLEAEEKVMQLEAVEDADVPEEIPPSPAYEKFMDEFEALSDAIRTLINEKKHSTSGGGGDTSSGSRQRTFRLPKLEIPRFSGAYTKWFDFKNEFLSLVSDNDLTNVDRFRFLKQALEDEPKRIIASMEVTNENYDAAWNALVERYDNKALVFRAHINGILSLQGASGPNAKVEDHRKFLDETRSHFRALLSLGTMQNVAENLLICIMLRKMDAESQKKWEEHTGEDVATWEAFTSFYEKYASTLEKVQQTKAAEASKVTPAKASPATPGKHPNRTFTVTESRCVKCSSTKHMLNDCPGFLKLSPSQRSDEVKRLKLCVKCLKGDHDFRRCSARCGRCSKKHNSLLHDNPTSGPSQDDGAASHSSSSQTPPKTNQGAPQATSTPISNQVFHADSTFGEYALIGSAWVNVFVHEDNSTPVRALLDSGSTTNLISERLARLVSATIDKRRTVIGGVGDSSTRTSGTCFIKISSRVSGQIFEVHASTLPKVGDSYPPTPIDIGSWNIPTNVQLADPMFNKPQSIDLLIGSGLFWHLLRSDRISLGPELPLLQDTELGYVVVGPVRQGPLQSTFKTTANVSNDQDLNVIVRRFWELDTLPGDFQVRMSQDDQVCEDLFRLTTRRNDSGRYVVQLPFRPGASQLGRSDHIAKQRFYNLERKLSRDPNLKQMYADFIDEYERLGHLERVREFDFSEPHYFIPHHCVLKPTSSTTKLRVVFDASCKTSNGLSLNDILLPGPKVQEDLFVILLRFRLFKYVVTGDVQKMYRQTLVDPKHANFQLIYWRRNETDPLEVLRLLTVTYGTAPGAFLAIRALQQLAIDEAKELDIGSDLVSRSFYVDDALMGADILWELEESLKQVCEVLRRGGLTLGKFCSNSERIIGQIPSELREKSLRIDDHEIIRTLGLLWEPEADVFRYCSEPVGQTGKTKRSVLSQMARIFDPLGLICPVVTLAKIFYQDLWKLKLEWDEPLPDDLQVKWEDFCRQLSHLREISIPRYVFCGSHPKTIELHGFSDASERAYGACVYVRTCDVNDVWNVELACARSRVAPTKTVSIARLELCAAKLLVDLFNQVRQKVFDRTDFKGQYFWTDSSITLSWIKSEPHRWTTFVAHRVTKIQESSSVDDWRHVPGSENPADLLSRGMLPGELANSDLWWHGPRFLRDRDVSWPAEFVPNQSLSDVAEFRVARTILLAANRVDVTRSMNFSVGFRGTRRAFAYALRFIKNTRGKIIPREARILALGHLDYDTIPVPDLQDEVYAEETFIKAIQRSEFPEEFDALQNNRAVSNKSSLHQLAPFIKDGLMRVGGRIDKSKLAFDAKHQILLPKEHPLTNAIVFFYHHFRVFHYGPQCTLAAVRTRYWPIRGLIIARKIVHNCIWCFRCRPRFIEQIMAGLPEDRVDPKQLRPFFVTGVDLAGPFVVRHHVRCRQEKKAYLALFICFATKAVHVELVNDLSTDAFLRALKRFIADRPVVGKIYSDNGTNFVGTSRHLKGVRDTLAASKEEISNTCRGLHVEWSFSPPRTPHHGGLWEASVKLLKRLVVNIAGDLNLTEDELRTIARQAAAVINSRPITALSNDPNDLEPLTPGHFLYGGPAAALPELPFSAKEVELKSVHVARRMICASRQLWNRFYNEYLSLLQPRTKWFSKKAKILPDSLVLLKEDGCSPLKWPLGRIVETFPGKDGVVRVVKVKTAKGEYTRGINCVALLPDDMQLESLHGGEDVRGFLRPE